jgi:hypothetical protein
VAATLVGSCARDFPHSVSCIADTASAIQRARFPGISHLIGSFGAVLRPASPYYPAGSSVNSPSVGGRPCEGIVPSTECRGKNLKTPGSRRRAAENAEKSFLTGKDANETPKGRDGVPTAGGTPALLGGEDGVAPGGCADEEDEVSGGWRGAGGGAVKLQQIFCDAGGGGGEVEVVSESVDAGEHGGVAGPAVREEYGFEGLLQFHVLAGNDVFVGENDAIPGAHGGQLIWGAAKCREKKGNARLRTRRIYQRSSSGELRVASTEKNLRTRKTLRISGESAEKRF